MKYLLLLFAIVALVLASDQDYVDDYKENARQEEIDDDFDSFPNDFSFIRERADVAIAALKVVFVTEKQHDVLEGGDRDMWEEIIGKGVFDEYLNYITGETDDLPKSR